MTRPLHHASFRRRTGALLYDAIAVLTVLYFAGFVPVLVAGEAIPPGNPLLGVYMSVVAFMYFALCWRRGRTLGMQAWGIQIQTTSGARPTLWTCALRYLAAWVSFACLGLGYLSALLNRERLTWHDRLSGTRLLRAGASAS